MTGLSLCHGWLTGCGCLWRKRGSKCGFGPECAMCGHRMMEFFLRLYSILSQKDKRPLSPFPVLLIRCWVIAELYNTRCHDTAAWSGIDWEGWEEGDSSLRSLSSRHRELDETNQSNCICNKRLEISGARTTRSTRSAFFISIWTVSVTLKSISGKFAACVNSLLPKGERR